MENVNVNPRWEMPRKGWIKINVHGVFSDQPLPNGNVSGIGIVIRNSRGKVLSMAGGTLGIQARRNNEFYAFMEGLKRAYLEDYTFHFLETDHMGAYWEWKDSLLEGAVPEHAYVVQQLNQRRTDKNYRLEVRLADPEDNSLAMYLAQYGMENWTSMVEIEKPFGRVFELWSQDMGLGPVDPRFMAVREEDLNAGVVVDAVNPREDVANLRAALVMFSRRQPNRGRVRAGEANAIQRGGLVAGVDDMEEVAEA